MPQTKDAKPAKKHNPDRFYCPFPGCNRSFAELWRLKVHYRAPPDVRGSGKERGHGTELKCCPKCGKDLNPGKHHVGCSAGRSAPRQGPKRQKLDDADGNPPFCQGLYFPGVGNGDFFNFGDDDVFFQQPFAQPAQVPQQVPATVYAHPNGYAESYANTGVPPPYAPAQQMAVSSQGAPANDQYCPYRVYPAPAPAATDASQVPPRLPDQVAWQQPPAEPSGASACDLPDFTWPAFGSSNFGSNGDLSSLDRPLSPPTVPSPPPLPPDWDMSLKTSGLLFDFDQFDVNKKHETVSTTRPLVTVTSAMNPVDVVCPSDDYIMQILFGDASEPIPRRMTTHLHHFEENRGGDAQPSKSCPQTTSTGGGTVKQSTTLATPAGETLDDLLIKTEHSSFCEAAFIGSFSLGATQVRELKYTGAEATTNSLSSGLQQQEKHGLETLKVPHEGLVSFTESMVVKE